MGQRAKVLSDDVAVFENAGSDGWTVAAYFMSHNHQVVLAELRIFPNSGRSDGSRSSGAGTSYPPGEWSRDPSELDYAPPGGISARLLRTVRLGKLTEQAHRAFAGSKVRPDPRSSRGYFPSSLAAEMATPSRAGRSDYYYAVWADRYVNALAQNRRSPVAQLAKEYNLSAGQVRDLVHRARVRGVLSPVAPGRAGGVVTEKGRRALEQRM